MPEDVVVETAHKYQTDKLGELIEYIKQEGLLTKGESIDLVNALFLAREDLRKVTLNGCNRSHAADWSDHLAPYVNVCSNENIREMKADRARQILRGENTVCEMLCSTVAQEKAVAKAAANNAPGIVAGVTVTSAR